MDDNEKKKSPEEIIIWVMDSDLCENCGQLLGSFGECPTCGWEGVDWENEEEEDEEEYTFGDYDDLVSIMSYYNSDDDEESMVYDPSTQTYIRAIRGPDGLPIIEQ